MGLRPLVPARWNGPDPAPENRPGPGDPNEWAQTELETVFSRTAEHRLAHQPSATHEISLIDVPDGCAEAVHELFSDVDGDELVSFVPKTVQRMLRRAGVEDPEPVAAAILRHLKRP